MDRNAGVLAAPLTGTVTAGGPGPQGIRPHSIAALAVAADGSLAAGPARQP